MSFVAITVEGGLFPADFLDRLAAAPDELPGQKPADFGVNSGRLSDHIQRAFSEARSYWQTLQLRLAHGKQSATTLTRDAFVIPVLESLDYTLEYQRAAVQAGGASYALSHRAGAAEDAPPVHVIAMGQALDERGAAQRSPHALLQNLLNRTDALWGIVTNGARVRLLRDTARLARPTYLEMDLQALIEGNLYAEFVVFFRLLHRSRFPEGGVDADKCLLERYYQQGIEEGGRVRENLRLGVEEALRRLGTGFLAHPANDDLRRAVRSNDPDPLGFYRQLLRLVYRLLFLMVAEERKLLLTPDPEATARQEIYTRWYSVARLRDRAERSRFDDPHHDLWEGLKQTFRLFEDGSKAAQLGLSPLDGELFGTDACWNLERESTKLANPVLLEAIFQLSTFEETSSRRRRGVRRRVNYAGLGAEELGSVYESLLDYHPHVGLDPPCFDLVAGSERKATGSYYTPPALVQELIKSALMPVIKERLAATSSKEAQANALLALKVCDPAAGSGHFLLAAAQRIGRELAKVRTGEEEPPPTAYRQAVREAVSQCLYAVDKNPLAVDLCKVALWVEAHTPGLPLSFLDNHVCCGDSLVGVFDLGDGIPDEAFRPLTGDDRRLAADLKNRNKAERKGQLILNLDAADDFARLSKMDDPTPELVQQKGARYRQLRESAEWRRKKEACDAWCAAFFTPLTEATANRIPTTDYVRRRLLGSSGAGPLFAQVDTLADKHRFFHWPIEFEDVFAPSPSSVAGEGRGEGGGFDVVLGNPPWERIKLQEQEFFAARDRDIATAPNKAARQRLINALPEINPALAAEFAAAKRAADATSRFARVSGRFPLTAVGDINTYALFAELFLSLIAPRGRAGFIVPTGIATDDSTKAYFDHVTSKGRLAGLADFENRERLFPEVDSRMKFCLMTLASTGAETKFTFFATRTDHLRDERRRFTLSAEDIALINPNTRTCPVFRSRADAELTKKIYARVPVLIDESKGADGNPWGIRFLAMFHMANDSHLFRTHRQLRGLGAAREGMTWRDETGALWLPLYEAKMIHHYDHRWATYGADAPSPRPSPAGRDPRQREGEGDDDRGEGGSGVRLATAAEKADPDFRPMPRYWVAEREVLARTARAPKEIVRPWLAGDVPALCAALALWFEGARERGQLTLVPQAAQALIERYYRRDAQQLALRLAEAYPLTDEDVDCLATDERVLDFAERLIRSRTPRWLMGWRDITNATNERTVIASALPTVAVNHKLPLFFTAQKLVAVGAFYANLCSLTLDYIARQKVGGTSLTFFILKQLPVLPPSAYSNSDLAFITPRVLELTYTAHDMRPFAQDLGYDGPPYPWDADRRALLKAELDAYYAYLYGLSRDELRYILDPSDVMGPDYPSETFRVLKKNEIAQFGEYRTRRLVLDAYDRFAVDGTFDPARLSDPCYFETVRAALSETKVKLAELEATYIRLLARADATRQPTLFVEGVTDAQIVAAAWQALYPGTPQPFTVLAAEGTKQMGSLAGRGKALRELLGDRLVFALADNDAEGRALIDDGHVRKGGVWRRQPNGIYWAMLKPTPEFEAVATHLNVPKDYWPFTLEACFPAALRRQAKAEGAYAFSGQPMSELMANPNVLQIIWPLVSKPDPADDASFYLMAPTAETKDAFARWVTRPERRTKANFAAFADLLEGLVAVIEEASLPTPSTATG